MVITMKSYQLFWSTIFFLNRGEKDNIQDKAYKMKLIITITEPWMQEKRKKIITQ